MGHSAEVKSAIFHPATREVIRRFPKTACDALGKAIWDLQLGFRLGMPLSKPMPTIAPGAAELRIKDDTGAYRAFYYMKSDRGILIFHAFQKRAQKTPDAEIRLGRKRLKELLNEED